MEYLTHVLGIQVKYFEELNNVPNFLYTRYRVQKVMLDGMPVFFVYPKGELDAINVVKKHIERIERSESIPAVLVLNSLTYRQKEYLLRDHIPFIVLGKQIYLPFMAVYLQERNDVEKHTTYDMLPSAQLLLLYYIYHGCGRLLTSEASRQLGFTATSISRASIQLQEMELIKTRKSGVNKLIYTEKMPQELFNEAKGLMQNPIKRTVYVPKTEVHDLLLLSSYSALSEYTMLNPPAVKYLAAGSIAVWENVSSVKLQNSDDQYAVELWRYDPKKLADGSCVDRLSLALSLDGSGDERVEAAVEEMLDQVWREIDGSRY